MLYYVRTAWISNFEKLRVLRIAASECSWLNGAARGIQKAPLCGNSGVRGLAHKEEAITFLCILVFAANEHLGDICTRNILYSENLWAIWILSGMFIFSVDRPRRLRHSSKNERFKSLNLMNNVAVLFWKMFSNILHIAQSTNVFAQFAWCSVQWSVLSTS